MGCCQAIRNVPNLTQISNPDMVVDSMENASLRYIANPEDVRTGMVKRICPTSELKVGVSMLKTEVSHCPQNCCNFCTERKTDEMSRALCNRYKKVVTPLNELPPMLVPGNGWKKVGATICSKCSQRSAGEKILKLTEPSLDYSLLPPAPRPSLSFTWFNYHPDILRQINDWRHYVRSFLARDKNNTVLSELIHLPSCPTTSRDSSFVLRDKPKMHDRSYTINICNPGILGGTDISTRVNQAEAPVNLASEKVHNEEDEACDQSEDYDRLVLPTYYHSKEWPSSTFSLISPDTPSDRSYQNICVQSTSILAALAPCQSKSGTMSAESCREACEKDVMPAFTTSKKLFTDSHLDVTPSDEDESRRPELKEWLIQAAAMGMVEEVYILTLLGATGLDNARESAMRNHFEELATELVSGSKRRELFTSRCLTISRTLQPPISLFYFDIWAQVAEMCVDVADHHPRLSMRRKGVCFDKLYKTLPWTA